MQQINCEISMTAAQQRLPLLKKCSSYQHENQQKLHHDDDECQSEFTHSTQAESANCEDYTCVTAFTPRADNFSDALTFEQHLPISTTKSQPKEETWLGKGKFRETCLSQRQLNKPTKLRRKEKEFQSKQASSFMALLADMEAEIETMNIQLTQVNQPTRLAAVGRQNGGVMLDVRNEALYI